MIRMNKYIKISTHMLYIILLSYLMTQRTFKTVTVKRIDRFLPDIRNILLWNKIYELKYEGQTEFIGRKCEHVNCYLTTNRSLLGDIRYFDAIIFNVHDVSKGVADLPNPKLRSSYQKYIFAANDSSDNYPVCDPIYEDFFNWTWTYMIDSSIRYKFITIYNMFYEELGSHFQWIDKMDPVDTTLKSQFVTKSKAAAIFLDKCRSRSRRELFIENLRKALNKYNLTIDVYGECGTKKCKRKTSAPCHWRLRKNYYFYLALEDSFSRDYITGTVLNGYDNNAVPIVFGAADYYRYLPPHSYLNGVVLGEEFLANKIYETIRNKERYFEYFRWKNHYILKESTVLDPCNLCEKLNEPSWLIHKVSYIKFRKWWNPHYEQRCNTPNKSHNIFFNTL